MSDSASAKSRGVMPSPTLRRSRPSGGKYLEELQLRSRLNSFFGRARRFVLNGVCFPDRPCGAIRSPQFARRKGVQGSAPIATRGRTCHATAHGKTPSPTRASFGLELRQFGDPRFPKAHHAWRNRGERRTRGETDPVTAGGRGWSRDIPACRSGAAGRGSQRWRDRRPEPACACRRGSPCPLGCPSRRSGR